MTGGPHRDDVGDMTSVQVEVQVRGALRRLTWTDHGVRGDSDAIDRLLRNAGDLDDEVAFLRAVRQAFGDRITTRLTEPLPAGELPRLRPAS